MRAKVKVNEIEKEIVERRLEDIPDGQGFLDHEGDPCIKDGRGYICFCIDGGEVIRVGQCGKESVSFQLVDIKVTVDIKEHTQD